MLRVRRDGGVGGCGTVCSTTSGGMGMEGVPFATCYALAGRTAPLARRFVPSLGTNLRRAE